MNVQKRNGVSIYCLSAGTTLPEWLGDRGRRNLAKRDESVRRRIELLQEFQMPAASSKLRQSSDGRYIMAAGTYPPRMRCYDVHELSMKFERYLNAECLDLCLLGTDYGKVALLLDDRTVAFHAHYGAHESVRIPTAGRALNYEPSTCELIVAARGSSVYRINLEEGRFREPWSLNTASDNISSTDTYTDVSSTAIAVHPRHPLCAVGCDDGTLRLWDARDPDSLLKPFLQLDVKTPTQGYGYYDTSTFNSNNPHEITAIAHDQAGLYTAVGTAGGIVALYDVRSSRPLHIMEHKLGQAIHTVRFHANSGCILSADAQLIKAWRYKSSSSVLNNNNSNASNTTEDPSEMISDSNNNNISSNSNQVGSVLVNIEGKGNKMTHFIVAGDENDPHGQQSGVLLCATDQPKMDSFFVPALGVAPRWCSFLENITEELEERDLQRATADINDTTTAMTGEQESVFENYKFVTRDELDQLGVSNLIGTPLLRGFMHGFFMDVQLYNRVRAVARPFEYEEYQKKKLRERLQQKQASRIAPKGNPNNKSKTKAAKTAVNPELAQRLQRKATEAKSAKAAQVAQGLLSDDRFGTLFTNPDFAIDEEDEDFKLRNPSGVAASKRKKNNLDSDSDSEDDDGDGEDEHVNASALDFGDDDNEDDESKLDDPLLGRGGGLDDMDSDSDEDGIRGGKVRGEAYASMKKRQNEFAAKTNPKEKEKRQEKKAKGKAAILQEADDLGDALGLVDGGDAGNDAALSSSRDELRRRHNMTLAERKALESEQLRDKPQVRIREGGSKEVTFVPRDSQQKVLERRDGEGRGTSEKKRNRRGVKELGFKTPFRNIKR